MRSSVTLATVAQKETIRNLRRTRQSSIDMFPRALIVGLICLGSLAAEFAIDLPGDEAFVAKRITLEGAFTLESALQQIAKGTGSEAYDRRTEDTPRPEFTLDLRGVTFWEAVEAIAEKANLQVSLYERDGKLAFVDGPFVKVPVSWDGVFRTTVSELKAIRNLQQKLHTWVIQL